MLSLLKRAYARLTGRRVFFEPKKPEYDFIEDVIFGEPKMSPYEAFKKSKDMDDFINLNK